MRNRTIFVVFLLGALMGGCAEPEKQAEVTPKSKDTVTVDYGMAEAGIEWLELVQKGADDETLRAHFFEHVAPTDGCQVIVRHWARFREWNEELFYTFILEALGKLETDEPLEDENGQPTGLGRRRRIWTAAVSDPAAVRRDLEALRQSNVRDSALEIARRYLPPDADITNSFHIVLFGASTAFSVGDANGFDLLQTAKTPDGTVDVERVTRSFAHEMHHSGFSNGVETYMSDIADEDRLSLVGMLAAEGMATWFVSPPFAHLNEYRESPDPNDRALAADWDRHLGNLTELYPKAEADIRRGLAGELTEQELMEWLQGIIGPAYVVGTDMCRTIEEQLGVEAAWPVARDYRVLLEVYNQAAVKANEAGDSRFVFDAALAEDVEGFTGEPR